MSKISLFVLVLLLVISAYPQEKIPLNHQVYDSWNTIEQRSISNNGMWVCYELKPQNGNSRVALYDLNTNTVRYFPNASMPQFSEDNAYLIYRINPLKSMLRKAKKQKLKKSKMPHDSIAILNLNTNTLFKAADIDKIILPEKGSGWILYTSYYTPPADSSRSDHADTSKANQKPARSLIIHKLSNVKEWKFPYVDKVVISKNAALIAFNTISKQNKSIHGLYAFDTKAEALVFEDHSAFHYKQIAVDEMGAQLAFLFSNDSLTVKYPVFSLALWNKQKKHFKILIDKHITGMYSHWGISPFASVYFSENTRRIFFGTARLHIAEPKDTLLEDEKASLNIWSWTDNRLQPQQLKELKKDREKHYMAMYDLDRKIFRQLGDESIQTVKPGAKGNAPYAIGYDFTPYQQMQSWKSPVYKDVYLINLKNGSRNLLCKQCPGNPRISPAGRYVYWFDLEQSEWISYKLKTKQKKRLTHNLPVHFEYEAIDIPREAWAYGAAGWTEDDNHFLVYDQYDIWQLDPDNI